MSKVLSLKQDDFESNGETVTCWKVELDDKTNAVPCYSAEAGKLKVGEPLPDGWEVKVSAKGKDYLAVPKAGGGKGFGGAPAAFRNTKEGFLMEQDSIHRSVALKLALKYDRSFDDLYRILTSGTDSPESSSVSGTSSPGTSNGSDPAAGESSVAKGVAGASQSLSNGVGGGGGTDTGEGVGSTSLDSLQTRYGSLAKALKAARAFYADSPPNSISDLTEAQIEMLLLDVARD